MTRLSTASAELARRGFTNPDAAERILATWAGGGGTTPGWLDVFDAVADPDFALDALERLASAAPEVFEAIRRDEEWLRRVVAVLGGSTVLAQHLVLHPGDAELLSGVQPRRTQQEWRRFVYERIGARGPSPVAPDPDAADRLRLAHKAALIVVAAEDLTCAQPEGIVAGIAAQLTHVADAILAGALAIARAEVPDHARVRFGVVALGKCGAGELNYVSDVDVLYVAEPAGEDTGADEAIGIATRLASALSRACSAHTRTGTIWPVDAALRPEGKAGPLVRTLSSMRAYYEKWAQSWEFQAMLKARPAAGDLDLGQAFVELVQPLVWRAGERDHFLADAQAMRQKVISLIPPKERGRQIKLGAGGLRDTEFSVQLLQLVHGRADERLRLRGTFEGLSALVRHGYIGRHDGAQLEAAYRFQRVLEHRVQLLRLRRTHLVPDDEANQRRIARTLGVRDPAELIAQWRASARRVVRHHQRIFYSPLLEAVSRIPSDELRLSPEAARTRLKALGFADPAQALRHIEALTTGVSRQAEIQRQLLPAMLGWFAEGPNPDFGLLSFRQISEALGTSPWYLRALRDEGSMAQRLARIASSSRYVVDLVKRSPEVVQWLASEDELRPRPLESLRQTMVASAARQDDAEKAFGSVRAQRRRELCRLALGDMLGLIDSAGLGRGLSDLAAATVDAALAVASRDGQTPPIGVMAMGRWSGHELGYPSDLDVWYVVGDDVDEAGQRAAQAAVRRMTDLLKRPGPEPPLDLDCDLRPEGKGGPMVRSVSSYVAYVERWAQTWEIQALLRARPGAGDLGLCQAVLDALEDYRYPRELTKQQVLDIRRLKLRMQRERIPKGCDPARHFKLGEGGLSDVEWTVQLAQLRHGRDHPEVRTPNTLEALDALTRIGALSDSEAAALREAWLSATRLRNLTMLVRGRAADALPSGALDLAAIGELAGYPKGQASQVFEDYRRLARLASAVVRRRFWEDE
ncbi:MAG: bifunctional [glutamine synthetase] adenylyltransferase/[glutamine synthetase]-adenylyl-L-tyrosine phosphorylase [Propionibacteriaceae bacterium]|nr:bifunctional [glutamine synthetase] adenylyltransferase/[glutamine synthetase]-adenylyl-L-tyrosine phosphorylase [Propionibacteriaceae bacterium]